MSRPDSPSTGSTAHTPYRKIGHMLKIVGVRLTPSDRVRFCDPGTLRLLPGDRVEIETDDSTAVGTVVIGSDQVLHSDLRGPLYRIIRIVERSASANYP